MKRQAFKFRLKPDDKQKIRLFQYAGSTRFIYNFFLSLEKEHYKKTQKMLGYNDAARFLVSLKKQTDTEFLKTVHSQLLQQKLKDLYKAFDNFFKKRACFPRYKKRGRHDSFRYPQGFKIDENNKRIYLPKIGYVRYYQSRWIEGAPKNITISYQAGHWYCSIQTEHKAETIQHSKSSTVGIDLGVARFATLSDGSYYASINSFRKREKKLARYQRSMSRKQKGSKNKQKSAQQVNKLHAKISHIRKDYLHKMTTEISKNHAIVVLEDLHVSAMSRSARGTLETPGKNVSAKSGLNKSLLDQGWYEFKRQLEYKLAWQGGQLLTVPAAYTSQKCSLCGYIDKENRKTQSSFKCIQCKYQENADLNAARNLQAAGQAVIVCGEKAPRRSMKQEPLYRT